MDPTVLSLCHQELATRFTSRVESPSLLVGNCPNLAELARKLFTSTTVNERDLNDLVYFSAEFSADHSGDSSQRAKLRGALAFIFCNVVPDDHDIYLVKQGNPEMVYTGKFTKKFRDTWAFMEYKRANNFNPHLSYTYKSGQNARKSFQESLLDALYNALMSWEDFRSYALESRKNQPPTQPVFEEATPDLKNPGSGKSHKVDRTQFISETVPDGSVFAENSEFTKTWLLRNAGNVPWVNRSVRRLTPLSPNYPHSAMVIPIPDTMPDKVAIISVRIIAPSIPGFSEVRFKMIDENGDFCWPNRFGSSLLLAIEVQTQARIHEQSEQISCRYRPDSNN